MTASLLLFHKGKTKAFERCKNLPNSDLNITVAKSKQQLGKQYATLYETENVQNEVLKQCIIRALKLC